MSQGGVLFSAFVFLAAAVVVVPVAKRLGLGSVLGYLIAGVAIGPFGFGLVGEEGQDLMHFAEFGVVMMLFLVGLELEPALLWRLRGRLLGLGGAQVAGTTAAIAAIGLACGLNWRMALAIGMILALSSTAIVMQTLNEKGLIRTVGGRNAFAVLLFQDIAVIPMLALVPLLASGAGGGAGAHGGEAGAAAWIHNLPGWGQALATLGAVAGIVLAGRFLVNPWLRAIAQTRLREAFTASALLLVIGIALLMNSVGLSPALGTFLAGVVLANSEYRHELESDIEPFKGLLLGLFFLMVGAGIDFGLVARQPALVAGLVAGLIGLKFLVLLAVGRVFRIRLDQNVLFAFALAQGGEFCFVLLSFAAQTGLLPGAVAGPLVAVVALSMALTPVLFVVNEKLVQPRFGTREREEREPDAMNEDAPVIIAGFGRFGNYIGRLLRSQGVRVTVLELDSDHVDLLRRLGIPVFFGDATRADLLRAAGAEKAKLLILAIDDEDKILEMVKATRKNHPHLTILARACSRDHQYALYNAGVEHVVHENAGSSVDLGAQALRLLGTPAYAAERAARRFLKHDQQATRDLAAVRHDEKAYIARARERIADLEEIMTCASERLLATDDRSWEIGTSTKPADEPPEHRVRE